MKIKLVNEDIKPPTNNNGIYSIYSPRDIIMGSGDIAHVELGFSIVLPLSHVAMLIGRGNKGIDPLEFFDEGEKIIPLGGILNSEKEWKIIIKNFSAQIVEIKKGSRVASFIVVPVYDENFY